MTSPILAILAAIPAWIPEINAVLSLLSALGGLALIALEVRRRWIDRNKPSQ